MYWLPVFPYFVTFTMYTISVFSYSSCHWKKVYRRVKGVPQSLTAANPWHQEEVKKWQKLVEPWHDKINKMTVGPAKTQISLGIHSVWSEPSLCTLWVAKDTRVLHADSKDWSDWADGFVMSRLNLSLLFFPHISFLIWAVSWENLCSGFPTR